MSFFRFRYEAFSIGYRPVEKISYTKINFKNAGFSTESVYHHDFHYSDIHHGDLAIIELPAEINDIEPVLLAADYEEGENDMGINVGYGDMDPCM